MNYREQSPENPLDVSISNTRTYAYVMLFGNIFTAVVWYYAVLTAGRNDFAKIGLCYHIFVVVVLVLANGGVFLMTNVEGIPEDEIKKRKLFAWKLLAWTLFGVLIITALVGVPCTYYIVHHPSFKIVLC